MKTEERKTLCTDVAQLKVGALFEYQCAFCDGFHREMITKVHRYGVDEDGDYGVFCECLPDSHPDKTGESFFTPTGNATPIYIIETGLLDEANPYVATKLKLKA